jgi:hypothetical protein
VVGNQIVNLIFDSCFDHNLCFRCPNGSCEPNSNICILRAFQWRKEIFNPLSFDLCNCLLKIWKSIRTPTPKVGVHLGVWRFIPLHTPTFSGAWDVILRIPSWPATLQALALVVSPKLKLRHYFTLKNLWNSYSMHMTFDSMTLEGWK